jgi:ADP-heptose:LPS heptosyltransferase
MKILMFFSSGLGDTLFVAPTVLALRDIYPSAHITAVVPYVRFNTFLLKEVIGFDDIIHLKRLRSLSPSSVINYIKDFYHICADIRKQKYDMVVLTVQSCLPDEYFIAFTSGAKIRIGPKLWRDQKNRYRVLLTNQVFSKPDEHLINMHFNLVRSLKPDLEPEKYVNKLTDILAKASVPSSFTSMTGKLMVVVPGSGSQNYKRWPFNRFLTVIEHVLAYNNCDVAIISSPNEYDRNSIPATIKNNNKFHDLHDSLSLSQVIDLFKKTNLVLSNDNGLLHLAEFLNVPTISIYPGEWKYVSRRYYDDNIKHIVLPQKEADPLADHMNKHIWRTKRICEICRKTVESVQPADVIAQINMILCKK